MVLAYRSNLNMLKAELLKTDQRVIELKASRKGLIDVLGLFVNQALPENTKLEKPQVSAPAAVNEIQRPELKLYSTQEKLLGGQYRFIDSKNQTKSQLVFPGWLRKTRFEFIQKRVRLLLY